MSQKRYQLLFSFVLLLWAAVGLGVYYVTGIVNLLLVSLLGAGAGLGLLRETLRGGK